LGLFLPEMLSSDGFGMLPVVDVEPAELTKFKCGQDRLDKYLQESAVDLHQKRLGYTTVVFHQDYSNSAVGYFTLSNGGIKLTSSEALPFDLDDELRSFPAVNLGRLAVAKSLQGQGIGRQLMDLVFGSLLSEQSLTASRLVIVDADNNSKVINFYEGYGFERSLWAEKAARNARNTQPKTIKMHRDLLIPVM
jgi:ribosomal protein S18 acetylase RimI-like enzyme